MAGKPYRTRLCERSRTHPPIAFACRFFFPINIYCLQWERPELWTFRRTAGRADHTPPSRGPAALRGERRLRRLTPYPTLTPLNHRLGAQTGRLRTFSPWVALPHTPAPSPFWRPSTAFCAALVFWLSSECMKPLFFLVRWCAACVSCCFLVVFYLLHFLFSRCYTSSTATFGRSTRRNRHAEERLRGQSRQGRCRQRQR